MEKNRRKVTRKLRKFYEREHKAKWVKVSSEAFNDLPFMQKFIANEVRRLDRHQSWVRKPTIQIGVAMDDFIRNLKTVRIDYTYPKYGNM